MSKKKTYQQNKKENAYKESYDLHTDAIDDLVNANADNTQEVPSEELEKYISDYFASLYDGTEKDAAFINGILGEYAKKCGRE